MFLSLIPLGSCFRQATNYQGLLRVFKPSLPVSQTLRWEYASFTSIWNHSVLQNGELAFPNGWNSISRHFFFQIPKCRFILFQYTNAFLCAKFGDPKPTIDEKRCPAQNSAEHHLPSSNGHYRAGINKYFDDHFHSMKHFVQSWPVLGVAITVSSWK